MHKVLARWRIGVWTVERLKERKERSVDDAETFARPGLS